MSEVCLVDEKITVENHLKPNCFVYLPKEGLQGEDIPSHVLWNNMKVDSVKVSFRPPLKLKEVFNAETSEVSENNIVATKVELEGYVGLSFESSKVTEIEVVVPVEFLIILSDGKVLKETKEIRLFRPQLNVEIRTKEIIINPKTGYVKGRIGIKNIGRGTLLMHFSTTEDSQIKVETPPQYKAFAERFVTDLVEELSNLGKVFPQFGEIVGELIEWENKDLIEFSSEDRDKYVEFLNRLANLLASDKNMLQRFVEAYAKAFAKNTELIEEVRKVIRLYESLVSRNILLINPFDEVRLTGNKGEIDIKISQTDRVLDTYKDIQLPKIELVSSEEIKFPIYRLFEWG